MEDGMCLVLFERPKAIERGDFDDGTAHIALQTIKEDFDRAADELKKPASKCSSTSRWKDQRGEDCTSSIPRGITFSCSVRNDIGVYPMPPKRDLPLSVGRSALVGRACHAA
jgi:hypothetical protein